MYFSHIKSLMMTLARKDTDTYNHCVHVAEVAEQIAYAMDLEQQQVERVRLAALFHDVGKVGIPDAILKKPGKLTPQEWKVMKAHPEIGSHLIETLPQFQDIVPAIESHHARWDGKGYPNSLAKEDIPLSARIIAIADTFEAMTSDRPYHKGVLQSVAVREICQNSGEQFDPKIVQAFTKVYND